jgi:TP901 family phage tail tape measure protein
LSSYIIEAILKADNYESGLKRMAKSTDSTTKSIQSSFDKIKVPTLGDLGRAAGQGALSGISTDINRIKTSFSAIGPNVAAGLNASLASFRNASDATKQFRTELGGLLGGEINKLANQDGPAFRYAMYDVADSLQRVSLVAGAAGVAVLTMSAKYETAFTDIERTTMASDESLQFLREQFLALSKDIPLAFGELTRIGSLGAQLGIANADLAGFTETVAQFAATTNVSIDSAATAFGALGELLDIDSTGFNALGSSIAFVGINSVATETEILSVATAISGVAAQAGVSKEFTIGLAGALASLRVPAEQSRGALTRVFQEINRAAAESGPQLQQFANILGISAEEAKALAGSSIEQFFLQLTKGLSGLSAQELTTALDSLQLADIRVTNTLARLATNQDVVNATLEDSAFGFENAAVLSALYANRSEDLASKFQILINSLSELAARLGDAISPTFGAFIDGLVKVATELSIALSTRAGKAIGEFAGIVGSTITVVFGLAAAIGVATASLAAFNFVKDKLGLSTVAKSVAELTTSWIANAAGANAATIATNGFKVALIGTGIGAAIVLLSTLAASFTQVGTDAQSASAAFSNLVSNTSGLNEALAADRVLLNEQLAAGNYAILDSFVAVNDGIFTNTEANVENTDAIKNTAEVLGLTGAAFSISNAALAENSAWLGENTRAWLKNQLMQSEAFQEMAGNTEFMTYFTALGGNMDEVINAAARSGQQGVINYFKTLETTGVGAAAIASKKISSAFQLNDLGGRVGGIQALGLLKPFNQVSDTVGNLGRSIPGFTNAIKLANQITSQGADAADDYSSGLDGIGNSASGAAKRVYTLIDYANDLSSIFERAFDIRFSGGQTLDKITSAFSKIAKATADARQEIEELNADIQSLQADQALQQYFLSVAEAYGDTLKAQEIRANLAKIDADLTKKTQSLQKAQDKTNKTLVGTSDVAIENRKDILDLVKGYQDHLKALAASGANEDTLRAKTAQLKAEFIAQATQLGYNVTELDSYAAAFDDVTVAINNVPRNITVTANTNPALQALNEFEAKARSLAGNSYSGGTIQAPMNESRLTPLGPLLDPSDVGITRRALERLNPQGLILIGRQLYKQGYSEGGYTGAGGKYDVAGLVHRGEYVVPKSEVNQVTKVPYFMEQPRTFAQGGYTGQSGPTMVMLSPEDRAILRNAGGSGNVVLYADGKELARAVNDGNRQIVAQGGRP